MGLPLLFLAGLATFALAGVTIHALAARRFVRATRAFAALATLGVAYSSVLLTVSLRSTERTLAPGDVLRFCGAFLDCHMGVSVDAVDTLTRIGVAPSQATASEGGHYLVVTLRVSSNAKRATLRLGEPDAVLVDAAGRTWHRDATAERVLEGERGPALALTEPVPAGASFTTPLVFDLPREAATPRLRVTDLPFPDRLLELVLIGDEDSLLHRHSYLVLPPVSGAVAARR
jgi:hypothetical protein